ncbi:MAG: hypothetical protein MRY83_04150 [Flavobacteriales bacterium]|nr:hypothetical protein [Flavobacteriales bacterium]
MILAPSCSLSQSVVVHALKLKDKDLFRMKLFYEKGENPMYNGSPSGWQWKTAKSNGEFDFKFDNTNQLTHATYKSASQSIDLLNVNYDHSGNIKKLKRKALDPSLSIQDDLQYSYNSASQLDNVEELGDLNNGFESTQSSATFAYDANGNMIRDNHQNLTVEYNKMNLPYLLIFDSGDTIKNLYRSDGLKCAMRYNGQTKHYVGGIEYINGDLEAVYNREGRSTSVSNTFQNEFHIKDHLGNIRIGFSDLNFNHKIDGHEILQELHYYPFGAKISGSWEVISGKENKYQYNGKEMIDELDLNWIDYGARWYDPHLGRWHTVDPLAERYLSFNPYAYVVNNPTLFSDPDGKQITIHYKDENCQNLSIVYEYGATYAGDNHFVQQVFTSFDHLIENDLGYVIGAIAGEQESIHVFEGFDLDDMYYVPSTNQLAYNPYSGLITNDGGLQSPVLGFYHELVHAWSDVMDPIAHQKRGAIADPDYSNAEERRVIEHFENPAAEKLGEAKRDSHSGQDVYQTEGPLTTKPENFIGPWQNR